MWSPPQCWQISLWFCRYFCFFSKLSHSNSTTLKPIYGFWNHGEAWVTNMSSGQTDPTQWDHMRIWDKQHSSLQSKKSNPTVNLGHQCLRVFWNDKYLLPGQVTCLDTGHLLSMLPSIDVAQKFTCVTCSPVTCLNVCLPGWLPLSHLCLAVISPVFNQCHLNLIPYHQSPHEYTDMDLSNFIANCHGLYIWPNILDKGYRNLEGYSISRFTVHWHGSANCHIPVTQYTWRGIEIWKPGAAWTWHFLSFSSSRPLWNPPQGFSSANSWNF